MSRNVLSRAIAMCCHMLVPHAIGALHKKCHKCALDKPWVTNLQINRSDKPRNCVDLPKKTQTVFAIFLSWKLAVNESRA